MFNRLLNLARGLLGLLMSKVERRHPAALLELEKARLRQQIQKYNEGLIGHAGLCERLLSQSKRLEDEEKDLRCRAAANLRAGDRATAGRQALRLQTVRAQLRSHREQAAQAEETYRELVRVRDAAVRAAQDKLERLRYDLDDLKVKQATAALQEMAGAMTGDPNGSGDNLARLSVLVDEERERAAGRSRVARDTLGGSGAARRETEEHALAEEALADFIAEEGIALSPVQPEHTKPGPGTPLLGSGED